jgi:hypothetical protein
MEIHVADERILLFKDQLTADAAQKKAWEKKISSFGTISSVTGFFSKPNDSDFELTYQEHRYQPFWHVVANAKYIYDRKADYQIDVKRPEVKAFTFEKTRFEATNNHIHMSVMEHCIQEEHDEVFVEGVTGKNKPELSQYLSLSPKEVSGDLTKLTPKGSILVPPQSRVSAIMRDALAKMIKGIQADTILEEHVEVTCVDLYYHPIFAFQYKWKSKNKDAIVEVDALTGAISTGNRTFNEYLGKVLDPNFLFDVGADAAGILIPGGSIAVKVAKKYIDAKKK